MKKCTSCLVEKPLDDFNNRARSKDGKMSWCKECTKKKHKKYYSENREVVAERQAKYRAENREEISKRRKPASEEKNRQYALKYRFGITQEQYDRMLEEQNGVCAICGKTCDNGSPLYIDHDHSCCPDRKTCGECVRQLLCNHCNFGIGHFKDNPELLRIASEYIEKHRPPNF